MKIESPAIDGTLSRAQTVGILRYLFCLTLLALALPSLSAPAQSADELPRAGAPRPLRLVSSDGAPLIGSPSDVAWERRGDGVFFTLERGGTRNIWRAFPDPQDSSRFPAWRALPVTDLRAPRYAAQPSPMPDDSALVCVSNALTTAGGAQIVRYDLAKSEFRALSDGVRLYQSPMVSPDGTRVAFTGGTGADARVFVATTRNSRKRVMPEVTLVRPAMRRPVWLNDNSLLMEGLAPGGRGLYWMPIGGARPPQLIVGGGGEANTMGENAIVFSAKTSKTAPTNLYVVARDGSGLRVLAETTGARRPATSPDGQTLAYDAPPPNGSQANERVLWVVPLLRVENRSAARMAPAIHEPREKLLLSRVRWKPSAREKGLSLLNVVPTVRFCADRAPEYDGPSAQLSSVRALSGGVAIIGSLRGATNANVSLEVGQGGKPRRWDILPVIFPLTSPLLDAEGNRVLATWNPPKGARGDWTLRLSLRGLGGGTQSLLRVRLPLPASLPQLLPPAPTDDATARTENSAANAITEPLPRATPLPALPDVVPVRGAFLPLPLGALPPIPAVVSPTNGADDLPNFPAIQSPDAPPTVPSPVSVVPPSVAPTTKPATAGVDIVPFDPARFQAPPPTQAPPTAPEPGDADSNYGDRPDAPADIPFVAQFDIVGTPARMAPRQKVKVTFWGINRGSSTWQTGSSGTNRVRLVARWVDFSTGTRRWWNFFWLPESVAPGERTKREIEVPAPTRPGKYKLIYGLVRLPASGEYTPPAYSASQESWADEFGAIAFAVEVALPSP